MRSRKKKNSAELEAQLEQILEQDGLTMVSPQGVKRRARRIKKSRVPAPQFRVPVLGDFPAGTMDGDRIASMDMAAVELLVNNFSVAQPKTLTINYTDRRRSEYVLSLRDISFSRRCPASDEQMPWCKAVTADSGLAASANEPAVYGTLANDLLVESLDPHFFKEQFTPPDFFIAHRNIYGYCDRLSGFLRNLAGDAISLFQRVERIERRVIEAGAEAGDELRDAVAIFEVPRWSVARALAGFVGLLLVVTLPANAVVLYRSVSAVRQAAEGAGEKALGDLMAAQNSSDGKITAESLKNASEHFRQADALLGKSSALAFGLASVVPDQYRTARALLEVGDKASSAGRLLALGFDKVFSDPTRRLDERMDVLAAYARGILPMLSDAGRAAATVKPESLPPEQREKFAALADSLQTAIESVREFAGIADLLTAMLGKNSRRTYLLVFQNNTELRPTGGFMGSVAEITMDRGAVKNIFVPPGGTYDIKGQLLAHVISPKPLHLINPHWQFQDANWFPDFPTSAEKIRWFWSQAGQPTLDGIIAVNASLVEKVFDVTGPIDMPEYGKSIDSGNFLIETQKAVELEYDKEANTPKKFIGDLGEALRSRLQVLSKDELLKLGMLLSAGLQTKEVQVYLTRQDEEALVEKYGWNGRMKPTSGDSLAVIEANIAGQKTDGVIEEKIEHSAIVQSDGGIIDRLKIVRTHNGVKGELFSGVRNVSYIRVYVPEGSELVKAAGFEEPPANLFKKPDDDYVPDEEVAKIEAGMRKTDSGVSISEENGRTVFGGWAQLDPGETETLTYEYRLPFTIQNIRNNLEAAPIESDAPEARGAYFLLLTSQSGKTERELVSSLTLPSGWNTVWSNTAADSKVSGVGYEGKWDRDIVVAALAEPRTAVQMTGSEYNSQPSSDSADLNTPER